MPEHDPVNHPSHYTQFDGVECIDVIEHMPHNVAAAIKYLWRHELKGNPDEDLRKAAWYVNRELERRAKLASHHLDPDDDDAVMKSIVGNTPVNPKPEK